MFAQVRGSVRYQLPGKKHAQALARLGKFLFCLCPNTHDAAHIKNATCCFAGVEKTSLGCFLLPIRTSWPPAKPSDNVRTARRSSEEPRQLDDPLRHYDVAHHLRLMPQQSPEATSTTHQILSHYFTESARCQLKQAVEHAMEAYDKRPLRLHSLDSPRRTSAR